MIDSRRQIPHAGTPSDLPSYQAANTALARGFSGVFRATFGLDPRLHDRREVRGVVGVFLRRELHVTGVLQHGEVVRLIDLAVAGITEAVLDLADPPTAFLV